MAKTLSPSIEAAWNRNLSVNRALVDHLRPEMVDAQTPGGGYTVAQHLAEIVGTHKNWGMRIDDDVLRGLPDLYDRGSEAFVAERDLERIRDALVRTAEAVLRMARAHPEGSERSPHADADAYLVHMMVHDAHHRGQILLALKVNGFERPDDELLWGPWRS